MSSVKRKFDIIRYVTGPITQGNPSESQDIFEILSTSLGTSTLFDRDKFEDDEGGTSVVLQ